MIGLRCLICSFCVLLSVWIDTLGSFVNLNEIAIVDGDAGTFGGKFNSNLKNKGTDSHDAREAERRRYVSII